MIRVKNIIKNYGPLQVLKDLTLEIPKGQVVSIIGPNGSGKSTLLGIISRTLSAEGGKVTIDDQALYDWDTRELAKHLAIMKQSEHIEVRITVYDLVSFGRYPYTQGRLREIDYKKIQEAIDYMDLEEIKHKYIDELSGGQKQRAYIASIFAQDTDYILLDEPLNNLDIKYASDMLKLLRKMAKECKKTIIIVIHDINFASCYSDHIILLKEGQLAKSGSVKEIMKPDVLREIYDLDFKIIEVEGKLICAYY